MPLTPEAAISSWQRLAGHVAPEVLVAPKTGGDPNNRGDWPTVHDKVVAYLAGSVVGHPWASHLALVAAVGTAARRDTQTVLNVVQALHPRFANLFPTLGLASMDQWDPNTHLRAYLKREILPDDTPQTRHEFLRKYKAATAWLQRWIRSLPETEQRVYRALGLPVVVHPYELAQLAKGSELTTAQQQKRKAETDAIMPQFVDIRVEAHFRYNRLKRLQDHYQAALAHLQAQPQTLPLAFSYDEGGDPERGIPARERLRFRIWNRRSFVLEHADKYHRVTVANARKGASSFTPEKNTLFLEFVQAERLVDNAPPEGLWFDDLLKRGMLGLGPMYGSPEAVAAKQDWLRAWGHGGDDQESLTMPFHTCHAGVLSWPMSDAQFMSEAQERAQGVLIPVEPLLTAARFGLLAIDLFTTTGMRVNELMQVRLTPDCLVKARFNPDPRSKRKEPWYRWVLRLIPKGERTNAPHDYFLAEETTRLLQMVAEMLLQHYGEPQIPSVAFDPRNGRSHRFGKAPYLFQYARRHLSDRVITVCMRFLLHGMVFRTRNNGQPVVVKAHLLRHAFATHAVQVERIPLDVVGALLHQKNLDVTDYYSKPTESMVAEAMDLYLDQRAAHLDVDMAVLRSPEGLRRQVEEARTKVGTMARVKGGYCVSHGLCAAKFVCVGCAGKVPDPEFRAEVEKHRDWSLMQIQAAEDEGMFPEAEMLKHNVRRAEAELREMDLIEAYRRDEQRTAAIQVDRP